MSDFYTIPTITGKEKLANALVLNTPVNLTKFAVGKGKNNAAYNPVAAQTALEGQVYSNNITSLTIDADNPNYIIAECVIPANVGGWAIREAGLFDDQDNLIFIAKLAETYKPTLAEGASNETLLKFVMEVTSATQVNLTLDPSIAIASRDYVDDQLASHGHPISDITGLQALLAKQAFPVGSLLMFDGITLPTNFIRPNGATVLRADYSLLWAHAQVSGKLIAQATKDADPLKYGPSYGEGDGTTTFTLPEIRGDFPRVFDAGRGVDAGRSFGSFQEATAVGGYIQSDNSDASSGTYTDIILNSDGNTPIAGNIFINHHGVSDNTGDSMNAFPVDFSGYTYSKYKVRPRNFATTLCLKYQ